MILSKPKPFEKVVESMGEGASAFVVGCGGCPVGCESGGETRLRELVEYLERSGKKVSGTVMIDFLCNKALVGSRLRRRVDDLCSAERVLVMACGIGVQAVANIVDRPVLPLLDTISAGGLQGVWPSSERCDACGDCVLDRTGAICPFTTCAKKLPGGPCGGSRAGKCEVDKKRDCGWYLIYRRLCDLGQVRNMMVRVAPRDHRKRDLSAELRGTSVAAIENERVGRLS